MELSFHPGSTWPAWHARWPLSVPCRARPVDASLTPRWTDVHEFWRTNGAVYNGSVVGLPYGGCVRPERCSAGVWAEEAQKGVGRADVLSSKRLGTGVRGQRGGCGLQ